MQGMDHAAMDHDAMMALHQRMMADPEIHAVMQADPEMQALMAEMMPQMDHSGMDHGQMLGMDHEMPMDADARAAMMARMRERMQAMTPEAHTAFMARMEAAHRRLMAEPAVHQRMMADPEMRRMMEAMPGMGQMEGMDHGSMDHSQMEGMTGEADRAADHSQMAGMDHTEGVAMQRRNAGAAHFISELVYLPYVRGGHWLRESHVTSTRAGSLGHKKQTDNASCDTQYTPYPRCHHGTRDLRETPPRSDIKHKWKRDNYHDRAHNLPRRRHRHKHPDDLWYMTQIPVEINLAPVERPRRNVDITANN